MNLLKYEFSNSPDGSINGMRRTLVKTLRYLRSEVPVEEFQQSMPELRAVEQSLQQFESEIGEPSRAYIDEIMKELDIESENESNLQEDLERATSAMVKELLDNECSLAEFAFTSGKAEYFHYLRFSGYIEQREVDASLLIVREVFRTLCSKYGYIFIDLS